MKPLRDLVLIKLDERENKTASGIFIEKSWEDAINTGTVLSVGEEVLDVEEGDKVIFNPYATISSLIEDEKFIREKDIIGRG